MVESSDTLLALHWGDTQCGINIRVVSHMLSIDSDANDAAMFAVQVDLKWDQINVAS